MALDLSARGDLTAVVYGAQDAERIWHVWAEFFGRPISLAILAFTVLGLLWPLWVRRQARRAEVAHG